MPDPAPVGPVVRDHLDALASPLGIHQHALGAEPDPAHGTCSDDVARALGVDLLHARVIGWPVVAASADRNVRYLVEALEAGGGRFRNQRAIDGAWLDEPGSEDCQGRSMLALAEAAVTVPNPGLRSVATIALERALPIADGLQSVRGVSSAVLACATILGPDTPPASVGFPAGPASPGPLGPSRPAVESGAARLRAEVRRTLSTLAGRLQARFDGARPETAWPWPEDVVTYEGALPPRALIVAGRDLGRLDLVGRGLATLDWLFAAQVDAGGRFHPVGNRGWWPRGGAPAPFDQQPIEATSVILAAATAHQATGDPWYVAAAEAAYAWFLGRNDLGLPLAAPARGACHDGLEAHGRNANQGAESTLSWLAAVEWIRSLRRAASERATGQPPRDEPVPASGRGQARTYARTSR